MRVLLLSAYAARSHVHWRNGLQRLFPEWQWQLLELPPRHFSWRIRGNPLYWALTERSRLEAGYDLLVATSMVDLATLRGLVPALARVPSVLYFHENQFEYPQQPGQHSLVEAQMVSLYAALAADRLAFNSAYNRDSFLAGVGSLLQRLPDRVPAGVVDYLTGRAEVLPVPIELEPEGGIAPAWPGTCGSYPQRPLRLVWSGRFEHDKGGDCLWHALRRLEERSLAYELALCGQRFRRSPPVFGRIEADYGRRLVHTGYLPSAADYRALLGAADVVLATALHEFQGLAVLEAVAGGCLPVVPDRQVYPEIYPAAFRYAASARDPAAEGSAAADLVCRLAAELASGEIAAPDVSGFGLARLRPRYEALLAGVARAPG